MWVMWMKEEEKKERKKERKKEILSESTMTLGNWKMGSEIS